VLLCLLPYLLFLVPFLLIAHLLHTFLNLLSKEVTLRKQKMDVNISRFGRRMVLFWVLHHQTMLPRTQHWVRLGHRISRSPRDQEQIECSIHGKFRSMEKR
jgi:hypothetical protein